MSLFLCRVFSFSACLSILSVVLAPSGLKANEALVANTMLQLGEARLEVARQVLVRATDRMASIHPVNPIDGHLELKAILGEVQTARSLLAVDADGTLLFDSFNPTVLVAPDLSGRDYFTKGITADSGQMIIHSPVVGKQSGLRFIPLTMKKAVENASGEVLVLMTFDPSALLPKIDWCPSCGGIIIRGDEVLAASSVLSDANQDIAARLPFMGSYGRQEILIRGLVVEVDWRKSESFDIIFVVYHARGAGDVRQ